MTRIACLLFLFLFFAMCSHAFADERIIVENIMGRDICEFYISAHAENDWGDDLFESLDRCIHHGEFADVTWNESWRNTAYDLRVVFRDGSDWVLENQHPNTGSGGTRFRFGQQD
ncbi:MAG: hypothetical protein K6F46_02430 [Desulfovibrio sp.]|nr:hypothetical protein [Desulfovibrio sp.]